MNLIPAELADALVGQPGVKEGEPGAFCWRIPDDKITPRHLCIVGSRTVHTVGFGYLRWGGRWGEPHVTWGITCGGDQRTDVIFLDTIPPGMTHCQKCPRRQNWTTL